MQRDSGFDEHFLRSILSLKVFSDQDDPLECSFLLFSSKMESIFWRFNNFNEKKFGKIEIEMKFEQQEAIL